MNITVFSNCRGLMKTLPPVRLWLGAVAMTGERRICLARLRFEAVDDRGRCVSNKWSISIGWKPEDAWVGAFWKTESAWNFYLWICLLPCLPIRLHRVRTWGGIIP